MLQKLKILGKKKFRLLKDIVRDDLNVEFEQQAASTPVVNSNEETVVIDYRAKFFEEQGKNEELEKQIEELNSKIAEIKKIVVGEEPVAEQPISGQ